MKLGAILEDLVKHSVPLVAVLVLVACILLFVVLGSLYLFTVLFGYVGWIVLVCSLYLGSKIRDYFRGEL